MTLLDVCFCGGDHTKIPARLDPRIPAGPTVDPIGAGRVLAAAVARDPAAAGLAKVVGAMLAESPAARPSAAAVARDLRSVLGQC